MELVFRQGDLIAPRDADYPDGALVVHGSDAGGNLLVHPLGGGFEMRLSAGDLAAFERVSNEEQVPVFTSGTFSIDGMEGEFEGWSDGTLWNGWEKPCFAREVAERILEASGYCWSYDPAADEFTVVTSDEDEPEQFKGEAIQLGDGGSVTACFVGAGAWIWEKI
jgi:hypothetical protein